MNKLNLPPFYVGQKVVCIKSIKSTLVKNNIYTVIKCGFQEETIDIMAYTYVIVEGSDMRWGYERFMPLQEAPAPLLTFEQIKQTEKEEILILN